MKKMITTILSAVSIFMTGMIVARADYDITNYQQNIQIQSDGNAIVHKEITYQFDDDMHGVYLKERLNGASGSNVNHQWGGLKSVAIAKNGAKFQTITQREGSANTGFVETLNQNTVQEKVYYPINDGDKLTVKYIYQMNHVVTNWDDIAEVNWLLISNWDVDLHHVNITLTLPKRPANTLKAWVHNDKVVTGNVQVDKSNSTITVTSNNVQANKRLELRTYFDKSQTPNNVNKRTGKRAQIIANIEAALVIKNHKELKRLTIIGFIIVPIIVLLMFVSVVWYIKHIASKVKQAKRQSGVDRPAVHIYDIPNDLGPAIINERIAKRADMSQVIVATLLDLIARHKVTVSYTSVMAAEDVSYQLSDDSDLRPFEKQFVKMIFGPKKLPVHQKDFKKEHTAVTQRIMKLLPDFKKAIAKEQTTKEIQNQKLTHQMKNSRGFLMAGMVLIGWAAVAANIYLLNRTDLWEFWVVGGIELLISVIGIGLLVRQKTVFFTVPDGFSEKWQWDGFAKMLHDIAKLSNKTVLDVQLWDKLLAYSVIFGEAKNVAKVLKVWSKQAEINTIDLPVYLIYSQFGSDWGTDLTQNVQTATLFSSNASGNGGSFSGGGFSGGGGGGGGAF